MNHIVKRTITALSVATIVVLGLLYLPTCLVYTLLAALIVMVHLEFSKMAALKYKIQIWPGVLTGAFYLLWILITLFNTESKNLLSSIMDPISLFMIPLQAIPIAFFILSLCALLGKGEKPIEALGTTLLGFLYIPFMLSFLFLFPVIQPGLGMKFLLYVLAITKISDMGGFAFGMAFGKHKMCPTISPKKSWEGMAGSIFASCLISCAFMPMTEFGWGLSLLLGVTAAVVGTLGDLVESRFKREVGVKDSSQFTWTNGMGGFLDMFDSLIFAPAAIFLVLLFWK